MSIKKGIVLAGGLGTRLYPLTKTQSKQLLPVYNKPMIYYPIKTLLDADIKDILIIVAPDHAGDYLKFLGSGRELGCKFTYEIQDSPSGLPEAFIIGENFIGNDNIALILGDNYFEDSLSQDIQSFESGARIFVKEVEDPERFGVAECDDNGKVLSIEEKPKKPKSKLAITGLYVYDNRAVEFAKRCEPSTRKETEIVDIHNQYLELGEIDAKMLDKEWVDMGTFESLFKVSRIIRDKEIENSIINK